MENKCKYSCHDCMEYKKEDCFGNADPEKCEDFKYSPHMTDIDRECWPRICSSTLGYRW